jgi:L-alanine-DL-glutamate epimerase-like enolase superfamily enzyme
MRHKIKKVEPILLSAPYASPGNMEVKLHLPRGGRTCGMVRITLENGLQGLGEGYLAVFAPYVFREIVRLVIPYIEGRYVEEHKQIINDLEVVTGYWSRLGAARHVLSAIDIALYDVLAQIEEKPLYRYLNPEASGVLMLYASGGDSADKEGLEKELDEVSGLNISMFKIRVRKEQVDKANWCISQAKWRGVQIAIDMTQNLMVPGQAVEDVITFCNSLTDMPAFIEEPLGPSRMQDYPLLRKQANCKIAGGEIITHQEELIRYIQNGYYDIAQPDATVIGGISSLKKIFEKAGNTDIYVHCWGGPVGMYANYHAAAAYGGKRVEWPLPHFPVRNIMSVEPYKIIKGVLYLPDIPGLGVKLTDDIIKHFPFRPEAIYHCLPQYLNVI